MLRYFRPGGAAFVGAKVVLDTAIFGPVHTAGYFTHMEVLGNGGGLEQVKKKLQSDFWPTFTGTCGRTYVRAVVVREGGGGIRRARPASPCNVVRPPLALLPPAECAYWPALQAFNFKVVPVDYQLLVVNFAAILDSAFMRWGTCVSSGVGPALPPPRPPPPPPPLVARAAAQLGGLARRLAGAVPARGGSRGAGAQRGQAAEAAETAEA